MLAGSRFAVAALAALSLAFGSDAAVLATRAPAEGTKKKKTLQNKSMFFPSQSPVAKKMKMQQQEHLKNDLNSPWRWSAPEVPIINSNGGKKGQFALGGGMLGLSPDGQTMVSGFHLSKEVIFGSTEMGETFHEVQFHTYTYLDKLHEWIPRGEYSIAATDDCPGCTTTFSLDTIGTDSLAITEVGMDSQWDPVFSQVQVYRYQANPWMPVGPPLRGDTNQFFRSSSTADQASFVESGIVVATSVVSSPDHSTENMRASVEVKTPQTIYPSDDPEDGLPHLEWTLVGKPIVGDNSMFGADVKLSKDGSTMAVVGSYDVPSDDDDDFGNLSCYIRVFEFQQNSSAWTQKGGDIKLQKDKYTILCNPVTLSGDGSTVMTGYRAYEKDCHFHPIPHGHISVFEWHPTADQWKRKGPDLDSFFPAPNSTRDFDIGMYGHVLSYDGNRVIVPASENLDLERANDQVRTQYLATFDWQNRNWTQTEGSTVEYSGIVSNFALDEEGKTLAIQDLMRDNPRSGKVTTYRYHQSSHDHTTTGKKEESGSIRTD